MAGRTRSHSEERWALLPETIVRCNANDPTAAGANGRPRTALWSATSTAAPRPQVRKRAAERLIMSADHVSQKLLEWLDDPEVPYRVRAEIAQDVLDRAGLIAAQVHQIIPTTEDPIMRFFKEAFSDPNNWEENPPQPAIEKRALDRPEPTPSRRRSSRLRLSSQKVSQPTTRRHGSQNIGASLCPVSRLHRRSLIMP
jgi:hypothetical protein